MPVPVPVPDSDVTMQEGGEQQGETRKRLWERPGGEGTSGVLSFALGFRVYSLIVLLREVEVVCCGQIANYFKARHVALIRRDSGLSHSWGNVLSSGTRALHLLKQR